MYGAPRPCKFGADCRNLAQGNCRFLHDPNTRPNPNPQQRPYQPRQEQRGPYPPQGNFGGDRGDHRGRGGDRPPREDRGPYQPNPYPREPHSRPKPDSSDISNQLCRMHHLDLQCKFGEKCNRKHYFMVNKPDGMHRFQFNRNLPLSPVCKLTKFTSGGKDYYAMRNNMDVNIFDLNIQTKGFNDIYTWHLPDPNGKFTFYDQKDRFIYFARENPDMKFQDLGYYSLENQKTCLVLNAHQSRITGIAHFNDDVVLSTSMGGELKVWTTTADGLQTQLQEAEKLKSQFNPQNANLELYFIDISMVNGMKITSIGTSDGRLVFFLGETMDYKFVALGEQYSRVFQVRYTTRQGAHTAVVLTWNKNKTHSAILQIDLSNGFQVKPLVELQTTTDQPKNTIHLFEFVHGYLMVATLNGLISIYDYPDTSVKIGGIHLQNSVSQNIVQSVGELKATGIKVKTMLVLEKMTEKSPGSLGVYIIN